jgi:hypothetical protein
VGTESYQVEEGAGYDRETLGVAIRLGLDVGLGHFAAAKIP